MPPAVLGQHVCQLKEHSVRGLSQSCQCQAQCHSHTGLLPESASTKKYLSIFLFYQLLLEMVGPGPLSWSRGVLPHPQGYVSVVSARKLGSFPCSVAQQWSSCNLGWRLAVASQCHLPCGDHFTRLLAWHGSVRAGDPSCPDSLLAPPLLLSQGLLTTEADALHRWRLCLHATEVPVESRLFGQSPSGWYRRPQGWMCRPDCDTAALCSCSQPPCGHGTQLIWPQPGWVCTCRHQSRCLWPVLQSRRLLIQDTWAQHCATAGQGHHHVLFFLFPG